MSGILGDSKDLNLKVVFCLSRKTGAPDPKLLPNSTFTRSSCVKLALLLIKAVRRSSPEPSLG